MPQQQHYYPPQPGYYAPPPQPTPPKFGWGSRMVVGLIVVAIGLLILGLLGHTPTTATQATRSSTVATQATAPAPAPKVLFERSGTGDFQSDYFTTGAEWQIQWSYDCTGRYSGTGPFYVVPHDDGPEVVEDGTKGSDVSWAHDAAGKHYLSVFTSCNWTVKVIG